MENKYDKVLILFIAMFGVSAVTSFVSSINFYIPESPIEQIEQFGPSLIIKSLLLPIIPEAFVEWRNNAEYMTQISNYAGNSALVFFALLMFLVLYRVEKEERIIIIAIILGGASWYVMSYAWLSIFPDPEKVTALQLVWFICYFPFALVSAFIPAIIMRISGVLSKDVLNSAFKTVRIIIAPGSINK